MRHSPAYKPPASRTRFRGWLTSVVAGLLIGPFTAPAIAQPASPVFVDDSPLAFDGLIRAGELASVGNLDESIRVLQSLLDAEGERLLATPGEQDLFTTVRGRVHAALISNRPLLDRYRAIEEPTARKQLDEGLLESIERSRLLTSAGYEAALRLAQRQIEAAQFHAALQVFEQLDAHPDRAGESGRAAAELMTLAAGYLGESFPRDSAARLARWRTESNLPAWSGDRAPMPDIAPARTAFDPAPATDLTDLLPRPLWSDVMGDRLPIDSTLPLRSMANPPREGALWLNALPTAVGDTVYANDTHTVTAWNRFTLSQNWRVHIEPIQGRRYPVGPSQNFEEMAGVAADGTYVAALMGLAIQNTDALPQRSMLCMDSRTGGVLWRRRLDDFKFHESEGSRFRGPVFLDQGIVVVLIEKDLARRRLEGSSVMGIDARTGEALWVRPLGSSGSLAYGYRPAVVDSPIIDRGVLYTVNRLGFIAAVDTVNGRVRWIHRWGGALVSPTRVDQPWQSNSPLVIDDALFAVTPDRREVVHMSAATGRIITRCAASKFGTADSPDYLIAAGGMLLGVSSTVITATPLDTFGPDSTFTRIARFPAGHVRGRVVAFGEGVMVPTVDGVGVYGVREEKEPLWRLALDKPGNLLPLDGQLLAADDNEVHTYLVWEVADRMLRERMDAEPNDPNAAITYAELSYRAGRPEGILPAIDRAMAAVERNPLAATAEADQSRLFRAVFAMVEPPSDATGRAMLPLDLRGALVKRLDRCANGTVERVAYLLAAGRFYEATEQPARAVEAYQGVLDSPELAASTFAQGETIVSADFEATRRLRRLVQTNGLEFYGPYQADADRALAALVQSLEPEPFESVARRYPVSRAAAAAWLEAASRYTRRGTSQLAAQALEEGLIAANQSLDPSDPLIGELTGRLVQHLARAGLVHPALAMLEEFSRSHATLRLTENGQSLDAKELTATVRGQIAALDRRPRIGPEPSPADPMLGWSILEPISDDAPLRVTDRVMMISEETQQNPSEVALFRSVGPGPLVKQWSSPAADEYLWIDSAGACFAKAVGEPDRADYSIVRRDIDTGQVKWETPLFRSVFPRDMIDELLADPTKEYIPTIDTPLESRVPVIRVSLLIDQRTLVLIDRLGRAAGFDLESGRLLWANPTTVSRMHDATLKAGTLVIGGADGPIDFTKPIRDANAGDQMTGVVLALDARTGQALHRWETQDRVRWVSLAPEGFSIVGLNDAIVSLDAYRGRVRWRATARPLAVSLAAWTMPGRVIVRTDDTNLYQIDSADGAVREPALDTRDRLAGGFGTIRFNALGNRAAFSTSLGLAVFGPAGDLVGLDTNERDEETYCAAFGERYAVTITPSAQPAPDGQATLNLNVFDNDSLKIVTRVDITIGAQNEPAPCALLDGKVLISTGAITTVIELPYAN
jgi:outer membrane protein assembly factor BamB